MKQINVPVQDAVYEAAKVSAARAGMLFKAWVERAIAAATDPQDRSRQEKYIKEFYGRASRKYGNREPAA